MKIVQLNVENFKRIEAVEIHPKPAVTIIGGKNAQGKSSVLDAIVAAFCGKRAIPDEPVRRGTESARIRIKTDSGMIPDQGPLLIERVWEEKKSRLEIKTAEGFEAPSPQAILDTLWGKVAFDPLAFTRMKPAEQVALLKGVVGLDTTEHDLERDKLYAKRTEINRDIRRAEAQADAVDVPFDAADEEVSIQDLMLQMRASEKHNKANEAQRRKLKELEEDGNAIQKAIKDTEDEIAELIDHMNRYKKALAEHVPLLKSEQERVGALADMDVDALRQQIVEADKINAGVRAKKQRAAFRDEQKRLCAEADALTDQIDAIDAAKRQAMAAAKWPVDGLGFSEKGVTYWGLPFEQASSAEQLKASVAIGFAAKPHLKVLLIRDGSLLDEDSLAQVAELAEQYDGQVFLEKVADDGECAVIISEGRVKE